MDIQSVRQAFTEAKEFYKEHFPENKFKAFSCLSWLLNPDYIDLLPNSNIVKFMKEGSLFPSISNGRDGLFSIFGRDDLAIDDLPTDNTMQKTMKNILQTKGTLHSGGIYILT